jgi:uncharacterized protein (DUF433 family)
MSDSTQQPMTYVVKTPGFRRGEPHIAGRHITVAFITHAFIHDNLSIGDISRYYDLTPAQIHAALAYYYDHQQEIEAIWTEEQRVTDEYMPSPKEIAAQKDAVEERFRRHDPDGFEKVLEVERKYPERDMTAPEIAEEFGISAQAVREAAANQRIPARKVGRDWIIKRQDAEQRWDKEVRGRADKPTSGTQTRAASGPRRSGSARS